MHVGKVCVCGNDGTKCPATGKDFSKVLLRIKRSLANKTEVNDGWGYVKLRDINLPEDKKKKLLEKKKRDGQWMFDDDFPNDEDEILVLRRDKKSLNKIQTLTDLIEGEGTAELDQEAAEELLGEGGLLADSTTLAFGKDDKASLEFYKMIGEGTVKPRPKAKALGLPAEGFASAEEATVTYPYIATVSRPHRGPMLCGPRAEIRDERRVRIL